MIGSETAKSEGLKALAPASIAVLLLADRGSAAANPVQFLTGIQPHTLLLSVEAGDRYGRPAADVLAAARRFPLLRTDRNGWIRITTDGDQMWVEVER